MRALAIPASPSETPIPKAPGLVVLNPEYGVRLGDRAALGNVYRRIGDFLKQSCEGYEYEMAMFQCPMNSRDSIAYFHFDKGKAMLEEGEI